ncbi:MAG: CoA-binding protein [Anaerolineales bacterium]
MSNDDAQLRRILQETDTIATVGFSTHRGKPSHYVPSYMMGHGYRVIPVNPNADEILGQKAYSTLADITEPIDLVQLFRPSDQVGPHVEAAIEAGARFIWMQQGIVNQEAADRARQAGLEVVMDRCMMVEHQRLGM